MSTRPIYTRNPRRAVKCELGLKQMDAILGTWSYQDLMIVDDDGNQVDPRDRRSWDRRWDLDSSDSPGGL